MPDTPPEAARALPEAVPQSFAIRYGGKLCRRLLAPLLEDPFGALRLTAPAQSEAILGHPGAILGPFRGRLWPS